MFGLKAVGTTVVGALLAGALGLAVAPPASAAGAIGGGGGTSGGGSVGGPQDIYKCVEDGIVTAYGEPYTLPDGCGATTLEWVTCITGALVFNYYGTAADPARSVSLSRVNSRSWNFCLDARTRSTSSIETYYYPPTSPGSSSPRDGNDNGLGQPYVKYTEGSGLKPTSVLEMDNSSYKGYPEYLTRSWAGNLPFSSDRKTDVFYKSLNKAYPEVQGQSFAGNSVSCQNSGGEKYDNYWVFWLDAYRTSGSVTGAYKSEFQNNGRGVAADQLFLTTLADSVAAVSGNAGAEGLNSRLVGDATLASIGLNTTAARTVRTEVLKYVTKPASTTVTRTPDLTATQFKNIVLRMAVGVGIPFNGVRDPIKGASANQVISTLLTSGSYVAKTPCYSPAQYMAKFPKKVAANPRARINYVSQNPSKYPLTGVGVILLERPAYLMRKADGSLGLEFRTFTAGFGEKIVRSDARNSSIDKFATCTGPDSKDLKARMRVGNSVQDLTAATLTGVRDAYCDSAAKLIRDLTKDGFMQPNPKVKNNPAQLYPGPFLVTRGNMIPAYAQDAPVGGKGNNDLSNLLAEQLVSESGMRLFVTNFITQVVPGCVEDCGGYIEVTPDNPPAPQSSSTVSVQSPRPYRVGGALRTETVQVSTNLPPTTTNFTYGLQVLPPTGYRYCTDSQARLDTSCDFTYTITHQGGAIRTGSQITFKFYRATQPNRDIQVQVVNANGSYTVVIPGQRRRVCTVRPAPVNGGGTPVVPTPRSSSSPAPAPEPRPVRTCRWVRDPDQVVSRPIVPSATIWEPAQSAYVGMTPLGSSASSWYFTSPVVSATDNP